MPYTPYITPDDFRTYSGGIDTTIISDDELIQILIAASEMADGFCQTSFQYQNITNEMHSFDLDTSVGWKVYPYYLPVRTIGKFSIAVGEAGGEFVGADIAVEPASPAGLTVPPQRFGSVYVDNSRGFIQSSYQILNYFGVGIFNIFPQAIPPTLSLSYTAGYDNGEIQDDGYSLPFPNWLSYATRLIAIEMVGERMLGAQGLAGIMSATVGDVHISRGNTHFRVIDPHISIPPEARELLRRHRRADLA